MAYRFPSAYNGFLPQPTGQVISYIRNPKDFKLNRYCQYVQSPGMLGIYFKTHRDDAIRLMDDAQAIWADGADRPRGNWNGVRFVTQEFQLTRRNYSYEVGHMALEGAKNTWDPLSHESGLVAQQAMINRTQRVITLLETSSNWDGNTDTADQLNGGRGPWDQASDDSTSGSYLAIKRALLKASERVNLATNSVVQPDDLVLLISPGLAQAMANTSEIHNYLKYGPFSKAQLEGPDNYNQRWGLPPSLYGFEVIVEDASRVSAAPAASGANSTTRAYVKSDGSAILLSRKGGLNGAYGVKSFSTLQMFFYKWEMAVEVFDQPEHKRVQGNVVDCLREELVAPHAGYLISSTLG